MQKNLYFKSVLRRKNHFKNFILDAFLAVASYPRLLLEVFIRKNFGERYFSASAVFTIAFILGIYPLVAHKMYETYSRYLGNGDSGFWWHYISWYFFLAAFLYFSWLRHKEVKRNPSTFDFGRFSLCTGDIHPAFRNVKISGNQPTIRTIEIYLEPAFFTGLGIVLMLFGQALGSWLIVFAIMYSLSYAAAYKHGDDFVLDIIDDGIMNEELEEAFVENPEGDNKRGVRFYTRKPKSVSLRRRLSKSFIENDRQEQEEPLSIAE